jgi:hypothetical protein
MPPLSRIASWANVPRDSVLEISVSGTSATSLVTGHVFSLRDDGVEQTFPDAAVQPGPLIVPLDGGHSYSFLIDLVYTTAGTAAVHGLVRTSSGRIFPEDGAPPEAFDSQIPGSINQVNGVTFFITTLP